VQNIDVNYYFREF